MCPTKSRATSLRALIILLGCATFVQETHSSEPQVANSWADVHEPSAWIDAIVDLVVPGTGSVSSTVEHVRAKTVTFRSSIPPKLFSAIAVPDAHTGETYVLAGGRFYISDKAGMTGAWLVLGTLNLTRSFLKVPTAANGQSEAIAAFASQFSERQVAAESEKYATVRLAPTAPAGFFVRGSQPVAADLQGFDVRDGVLRLDLRSQSGTTGSFWVDLTTLKVTKTTFGR